MNVLRDNENMQHLSTNHENVEYLKCHGQNSVKDYLSSVKMDTTTGVDSFTATPSRFNSNI